MAEATPYTIMAQDLPQPQSQTVGGMTKQNPEAASETKQQSMEEDEHSTSAVSELGDLPEINVAQAFTLFSMLPTELQQHVWRLAEPEPQIIRFRDEYYYAVRKVKRKMFQGKPVFRVQRVPALLSVNSQSRHVALQSYDGFMLPGSRTRIRLSTDIVFFTMFGIERWMEALDKTDHQGKGVITKEQLTSKLKHVAIRHGHQLEPELKALTCLKGLESVTVLGFRGVKSDIERVKGLFEKFWADEIATPRFLVATPLEALWLEFEGRADRVLEWIAKGGKDDAKNNQEMEDQEMEDQEAEEQGERDSGPKKLVIYCDTSESEEE